MIVYLTVLVNFCCQKLRDAICESECPKSILDTTI